MGRTTGFYPVGYFANYLALCALVAQWCTAVSIVLMDIIKDTWWGFDSHTNAIVIECNLTEWLKNVNKLYIHYNKLFSTLEKLFPACGLQRWSASFTLIHNAKASPSLSGDN